MSTNFAPMFHPFDTAAVRMSEDDGPVWISFGLDPSRGETDAAREELQSIGVIVGPHDGTGTFDDCVVSDRAFDKLDPMWGRYIWG